MGAIDIAGNMIQSKIEYERSKKLMDLQQQNQMELNKQGQQLQLDTWAKTNYPAQMEMLKKAGLNPSLMYAKGGTGGTTGGQGGGSASMASAPHSTPMNLPNIMEIMSQKANIDLMKAQAHKTEVEAAKIGGVDTEKGIAEIDNLIASAENTRAATGLTKVKTAMEEINTANQQDIIDASLDKIREETRQLILNNSLTEDNYKNIVKETANRVIMQTLEMENTTARTKLTKAEIESVTTAITQKWSEIYAEWYKLGQKDKEIAIEKFKSEITAEYPSVMNMAGSVLKKAFNSLNMLIDPWNADKYGKDTVHIK